MRGRWGALFTAHSTTEAARLFKRTTTAFGASLLVWSLYLAVGVPVVARVALPAWAVEVGLVGGIGVEVALAAAVLRTGVEYLAWVRRSFGGFE